MPPTEDWWYSCWWVWDLRIPTLAPKFSLKLTILSFWIKFAQKERFWSKKKKVNTAVEFYIIELVKVSSLTLSSKYWQFGPNLSKKGVSVPKQKNWTASLNSAYSNQVSSFTLSWQFWFIRPNCPKQGIPTKNKRSEHHHWILHNWISLCIKFHLQLTILTFWTKFAQKSYPQAKTEKMTLTVAFCIFELV